LSSVCNSWSRGLVSPTQSPHGTSRVYPAKNPGLKQTLCCSDSPFAPAVRRDDGLVRRAEGRRRMPHVENRSWGYDRVVLSGRLIGVTRFPDQTVAMSLRRHDIPRAQERKRTRTWAEFQSSSSPCSGGRYRPLCGALLHLARTGDLISWLSRWIKTTRADITVHSNEQWMQ
jgi:hypothetical protein